MIELTEQQHFVIAGNEREPIPVIDPHSKSQYVLVPSDMFDRWKSIVDEDDARLMSPLLANLDPEDWEDVSAFERRP